jgi:hypothetical protein
VDSASQKSKIVAWKQATVAKPGQSDASKSEKREYKTWKNNIVYRNLEEGVV